jgi:hypothetical protein
MALLACIASAPAAAIDLDVTVQDLERALTIARDRDTERANFHAPYIRKINSSMIETVEVISEYRRGVLLAEDRARKGDRMFGYSSRLLQDALSPWKQRVSIVARLRFHPQNTYVNVPQAEIALQGDNAARVGTLKEPILSLPSSNPADRVPILGAVVESVFDAVALAQGVHEFIIRVDSKEVGRVTFNLATLE